MFSPPAFQLVNSCSSIRSQLKIYLFKNSFTGFSDGSNPLVTSSWGHCGPFAHNTGISFTYACVICFLFFFLFCFVLFCFFWERAQMSEGWEREGENPTRGRERERERERSGAHPGLMFYQSEAWVHPMWDSNSGTVRCLMTEPPRRPWYEWFMSIFRCHQTVSSMGAVTWGWNELKVFQKWKTGQHVALYGCRMLRQVGGEGTHR